MTYQPRHQPNHHHLQLAVQVVVVFVALVPAVPDMPPNVPLLDTVKDYIAREVLPHAPDSYVDEGFRDEYDGQVGVVGYEINFNRHFYQFTPPRRLVDIDADLKKAEDEILRLLREVTE
jgi:hypothetical protein